jgi:hypothetical protein
VGMEGEVITMQEIFAFERQGVDEKGGVLGRFRSTGIRPRCSDRLQAYGINLGELLFAESPGAQREKSGGLRPLTTDGAEPGRGEEW